jgi:hypothetical protein
VVVNAGVKEEWEMKHRRRKGVRAIILALATAAILVPAASAKVYDGGSAGYVNIDKTSAATGYQQVRPDDRGGVRGTEPAVQNDLVDRQVAIIEANSANAVRPDNRIGIRGPGPVESPRLVTTHGDGFDWTDAGIGASATLLAAVLLAAAVIGRRRTGLAV